MPAHGTSLQGRQRMAAMTEEEQAKWREERNARGLARKQERQEAKARMEKVGARLARQTEPSRGSLPLRQSPAPAQQSEPRPHVRCCVHRGCTLTNWLSERAPRPGGSSTQRTSLLLTLGKVC